MESPFVYILQAGENGPIKIGMTRNSVKGRFKAIQTHCPYKLDLLVFYQVKKFDRYRMSENRLHSKFSHERVRGEWFRPSRALIDFINQIRRKEIIENESFSKFLSSADINKGGRRDAERDRPLRRSRKEIEKQYDKYLIVEGCAGNADRGGRQGMKQVELAKRAGITEGMVSFILSGERRPSWDVAKKLAAATGTDPYLWMESNWENLKKAVKEAE